MKISIIILFFFYSVCQREKLQIINIDNPNFRPQETSNLEFVFNFMKHGASSPCYGLNDQYIDIFGQQWNGYCELTKKGFLQLFKLGKIYQQRYYRLLNLSDPNVNKVRAFASQANKTLMSSNALFYGLFINKDSPIEEQLTVPVRNFKSFDGDELFPLFYFTDKENCKGWKKLADYNKNNINKLTYENDINKFLNRFMSMYKKIFNLLKNEERMKKSKSLLDKADLFCNSYISNYYDDRYKNIRLFKKLKYTEDQFYYLYYDCIELNLHRYMDIEYGGEAKKVPMIVLSELVHDMISYMDSAIREPNSPKFVTYVGHDSTLAALQVILEKGFNISPKLMNFASNQIFHLHKVNDSEDIDKNYDVKYFYNDQLSMIVGYDEFKKGLLDLLKTNYKLELFCQGFKMYDYIALGLCSGIIFLLFSIISICCYHKNSIFNKRKYISLKEEVKEKSVDIKN